MPRYFLEHCVSDCNFAFCGFMLFFSSNMEIDSPINEDIGNVSGW